MRDPLDLEQYRVRPRLVPTWRFVVVIWSLAAVLGWWAAGHAQGLLFIVIAGAVTTAGLILARGGK